MGMFHTSEFPLFPHSSSATSPSFPFLPLPQPLTLPHLSTFHSLRLFSLAWTGFEDCTRTRFICRRKRTDDSCLSTVRQTDGGAPELKKR